MPYSGAAVRPSGITPRGSLHVQGGSVSGGAVAYDGGVLWPEVGRRVDRVDPARSNGKPAVQTQRLNLRLEPALMALLVDAAAACDVALSEWCRDALRMRARQELGFGEDVKTRIRTKRRGLTVVVIEGQCVHPRHAIQIVGLQRKCMACDTVVGLL